MDHRTKKKQDTFMIKFHIIDDGHPVAIHFPKAPDYSHLEREVICLLGSSLAQICNAFHMDRTAMWQAKAARLHIAA